MISMLDLEKAYDGVEWNFMEEILRKIAFERKLLNVVLSCIKSTRLSVIWNGS